MRRSCLYDSIRSAASRRPGQLDVAALARCDRTCRPTPVALSAKIPNARPSMLLDATLKRRGEVDAISFTARRDDLTEVCVLVSGRVTLEVEGREPVTLGARRLLRDTSRMGRDRACPRDGAQGLSDRQRPGPIPVLSPWVSRGPSRLYIHNDWACIRVPPQARTRHTSLRTACDAASVALPLRRGDRRCAACQVVAAAG